MEVAGGTREKGITSPCETKGWGTSVALQQRCPGREMGGTVYKVLNHLINSHLDIAL